MRRSVANPISLFLAHTPLPMQIIVAFDQLYSLRRQVSFEVVKKHIDEEGEGLSLGQSVRLPQQLRVQAQENSDGRYNQKSKIKDYNFINERSFGCWIERILLLLKQCLNEEVSDKDEGVDSERSNDVVILMKLVLITLYVLPIQVRK